MNQINGTCFMTQEDFSTRLTEVNMQEDCYPVGGIPLLVNKSKIYLDAEDNHTMIFGATGSKKTRMFVMPSIGIFARAGESFVVTDPKGELYNRTNGDVRTHGYECCCINLRDFKAGSTWNPLVLPYRYYHGGKKAKAMECAMEMARMVIGENATTEVFWTNTAVDIFCGFILLLFEKASEKECHMKGLFQLWEEYIANRKQVIRMIKEEYGNTVVYQKLAALNNPSDKTVGSIEAFITMGLNKLCINEDFVGFISQEGVDIEKLTDQKNAIYLIIPDENRTYHFVASLFLEQLYEVLIDRAQKEPENKLPNRMNFLVDEFANLPKIENMESMITASRSRNIRFHIVVQGMKQLQQKYQEGASVICGNCNNWVYLYSKEYELLQTISRLCGEIIYENNVKLPLFSEFDLQHLSKEEGEALVLSGRNFPCLTRLVDIDEYPYPVLETKAEIQSVPWKKVDCTTLLEKEQTTYFCELKDEYEKIIWEEEEERWLTAVGQNGMIMAEGIYKKWMVDSKAAMGAMICSILKEKRLESKYLKWYSAAPGIRYYYEKRCKRHPEMIYTTLEELGIEEFTEEIYPGESCVLAEQENCEVELYFINTKGEEELLKAFTERVDYCCESVGRNYLLNVAFRSANLELMEGPFADAKWSYTEEGITPEGGVVWKFEKKNSKGEKMVLVVK